MDRDLQTRLISRIADLLEGCEHVAVGASSPIPAAGALLAKVRNPETRVSLLGSEKHTAFTDGGRELFDCAAQGRIDAFFLSGVQIDGAANINLVGTGSYPDMQTRFSGSFGSAYLYHLIPKIILFCWAHNERTLVDKVDFISAAGPADDGVWRCGGPTVLLTDRCEFDYDAERRGFSLARLQPGQSENDIAQHTGFEYETNLQSFVQPIPEPLPPGGVVSDNRPNADTNADTRADTEVETLLADVVLPTLEETYPRFVSRFMASD